MNTKLCVLPVTVEMESNFMSVIYALRWSQGKTLAKDQRVDLLVLKSLKLDIKDEMREALEAKIAPVYDKYKSMIKPKLDRLLEEIDDDIATEDLPPTITVLNKLIKFTHTLQVSHPVTVSTVDSKLIALLNWLERCYSAISKIGGDEF